MKQGPTLFARGIVYLMGFAALAVCLILLPELAREEAAANPGGTRQTIPFFVAAYVLTIPFFIALYQVLKLLRYIDEGTAFSAQAVYALKNIKTCAITFSALVVVATVGGISWAQVIDPTEDVTGFVTLGFIFTFISSVIATFAAVLQRLLRDAIAMKAENDLTV